MISSKKFVTDGQTVRFMSDFIIKSFDHARVYIYKYDNTCDNSGTCDTVDQTSGYFIREDDQPLAEDLVSADKYDLIDNSIVFYERYEPVGGLTMWIEVATTPDEFSDILATPAVSKVDALKEQAKDLRDETQVLRDEAEVIRDETQTIKDNAVSETNQIKNDTNTIKGETQTIKDNAVSETNQIKDDTQAIHDATVVLRDETQVLRDETEDVFDDTVAMSNTFITKAPDDGTIYGRRNDSWVEIETDSLIKEMTLSEDINAGSAVQLKNDGTIEKITGTTVAGEVPYNGVGTVTQFNNFKFEVNPANQEQMIFYGANDLTPAYIINAPEPSISEGSAFQVADVGYINAQFQIAYDSQNNNKFLAITRQNNSTNWVINYYNHDNNTTLSKLSVSDTFLPMNPLEMRIKAIPNVPNKFLLMCVNLSGGYQVMSSYVSVDPITYVITFSTPVYSGVSGNSNNHFNDFDFDYFDNTKVVFSFYRNNFSVQTLGLDPAFTTGVTNYSPLVINTGVDFGNIARHTIKSSKDFNNRYIVYDGFNNDSNVYLLSESSGILSVKDTFSGGELKESGFPSANISDASIDTQIGNVIGLHINYSANNSQLVSKVWYLQIINDELVVVKDYIHRTYSSSYLALGIVFNKDIKGRFYLLYKLDSQFAHAVGQFEITNTNLDVSGDTLLGILKESGLNGESKKVSLLGGSDDSLTGLTILEKYYVDKMGDIVTSDENQAVLLGTAIATDIILLKGK